jgi:SAM-dependent methyltransferase
MVQNKVISEVPSPVDFSDPAQALSWVQSTIEKRPWRPRFFEAFVGHLNSYFDSDIRIAELGSGPGHLAKAIVEGCNVRTYKAIDFSDAMHDLARVHLEDACSRVTFMQRDFRRADWMAGLGPLDAIVTMQAAHELRHKTRLPVLLAQINSAVRTRGLLLFCDHYAEAGSAKNFELYPTFNEQPILLGKAGFSEILLLHNEGGMALYQCVKN